MSDCTWVDCEAAATHPQVGRDGVQWADLCKAHDDALTESMPSDKGLGTVPKMLAAYIKAQGGAKKVARKHAKGAADGVAALLDTLYPKKK